MTKRPLLLLAVVLAAALLTPTHASAQVFCDSTVDGGTCIDNFSTEAGGGGYTESNICNNSFGCMACEANAEITKSVCVRLMNGNGACTCSNPKAIAPGGMQRCTISGSCRYRR